MGKIFSNIKKFSIFNIKAFVSFLGKKISRRLVLTNLFLSIFPIIIVSFIFIFINNKTISNYIFQRNLETAKRAVNEINLFLETPRRVLVSLANSPAVSSMDRFGQNLIITKIKADYPLFKSIFIVRNNGKLAATTSYERSNIDFTHQPKFTSALKGKEYFSAISFTQNQSPIMSISEPILKYGKVIAVIIGEIDIKSMWDLLDGIKIGETGNAFLFSADGTVIAHSNKQNVILRKKINQYKFYKEIINGRSGILKYKDDNGISYLAAYIPVSEFSWGLVLQQTEKEAFELTRKLLMQIISILIATSIFSIVTSLFLVKRFTTPLFHLIQGVQHYSKGNLKHEIILPYDDELSVLAIEFNEMAKNLVVQQTKLQKMERMSTMSRFASMVSHEIRNPLNSMGINMQMVIRLAQKQPVPVEKLKHFTSMISNEIERIDELIKNFLTIARPSRLNLLSIDVNNLLNGVVNIHLANAKTKKIGIIKDFTDEEVIGNYDENQLKQVFSNIILNAFDALLQGGVITIKTNTFIRNNQGLKINVCQIEFRDNGMGIPQEYIEEIFDMYFTTKKTGTGLGLAIAKQIIESHDGIIYINSKKGVGTSVYVELPYLTRN